MNVLKISLVTLFTYPIKQEEDLSRTQKAGSAGSFRRDAACSPLNTQPARKRKSVLSFRLWDCANTAKLTASEKRLRRGSFYLSVCVGMGGEGHLECVRPPGVDAIRISGNSCYLE